MRQTVKTTKQWLTYLVIGTLLGLSCNNPARAQAGAQAPLEGTIWVLQAFGDPKSPTFPVTGSEITVQFGGTQPGRVTGSAGCNSYFGDYKVDSENLLIGPQLGATKKFCGDPAGLMDQENQYQA